MRRLQIVALALVLATLAAAEDVTFTRQPHAVGLTCSSTDEVVMEFKITALIDGKIAQDMEQGQQESNRIRFTVLAVKGDAVAEMRVMCVQALQRVKGKDGKLHDVPHPCQGKTYVAQALGADVKVTNEKGEPATEDEADWVKEQCRNRSMGKVDPFEAFLAGKTFRVGAPVEISNETAASLLDVGAGGLNVEKFSLTLKAVRAQGTGKQAVFDAAAVLSQKQGRMKTGIELAGELVVDPANCWPVSLQIKGPIKVSGQQTQGEAKVDLNGAGTMSASQTFEYGPVMAK